MKDKILELDNLRESIYEIDDDLLELRTERDILKNKLTKVRKTINKRMKEKKNVREKITQHHDSISEYMIDHGLQNVKIDGMTYSVSVGCRRDGGNFLRKRLSNKKTGVYKGRRKVYNGKNS